VTKIRIERGGTHIKPDFIVLARFKGDGSEKGDTNRTGKVDRTSRDQTSAGTEESQQAANKPSLIRGLEQFVVQESATTPIR